MKVSDVMQKDVDYVEPNTLISDVTSLIFGRKINGVPVVKNKKIVGFITEGDILSKFYPTIEEFVDDPVRSRDYEGMEKKINEIFSLPTEKVMSRTTILTKADTPLLKALSIMSVNHVGRLPVIDKNNHLVGIIAQGDIFQALVGNKLEFNEKEEHDLWFLRHSKLFLNWNARLKTEAPDLIKIFKKNKVDSILDVGCGTGEHTIALAKNSYKVFGFEREKLLIDEANKKKSKLPEKVKNSINFYSGEYEKIIPKLKNDFQAAIFMGNAIAYNPDHLREIIKTTNKKLSGSKTMIFQIINIEKILKDKGRYNNLIFTKDDLIREHALLEFYNPSKDRGKTVLKTVSIYDFYEKSWRCFGVKNVLMAYVTQKKIDSILRSVGYKNISFYGSLFRAEKWDKLFKKSFEVSKSDWMNVIATK